jgi:hypothetical protein
MWTVPVPDGAKPSCRWSFRRQFSCGSAVLSATAERPLTTGRAGILRWPFGSLPLSIPSIDAAAPHNAADGASLPEMYRNLSHIRLYFLDREHCCREFSQCP